jgi:hypothetical protein
MFYLIEDKIPVERLKNLNTKNKLREIKATVGKHFEKEMKVKKKIIELEQIKENDGFSLFAKELSLCQNNQNQIDENQQYEFKKEIEVLIQKIEGTTLKIKQNEGYLNLLESQRPKFHKVIYLY